VCGNTWKKGDEIFADNSSGAWITCSDEECFKTQGGKPYVPKGGSSSDGKGKSSVPVHYTPATDEEKKRYQNILENDDQLVRLAYSQVVKQGHDPNASNFGAIVAHKQEMLIRLKAMSTTETDSVISFAKKGLVTGSSSHKLSAGTVNMELSKANTVEEIVQYVRLNVPFFSDSLPMNDKVKIVFEEKFGIILPDLPIAWESVSREIRNQTELQNKKLEEEKKMREKYSPSITDYNTKLNPLLHNNKEELAS
tara:strand:+ start:544 stop:1299 length:756 start_codon:yes stop_codon:yes gene_type:complete